MASTSGPPCPLITMARIAVLHKKEIGTFGSDAVFAWRRYAVQRCRDNWVFRQFTISPNAIVRRRLGARATRCAAVENVPSAIAPCAVGRGTPPFQPALGRLI